MIGDALLTPSRACVGLALLALSSLGMATDHGPAQEHGVHHEQHAIALDKQGHGQGHSHQHAHLEVSGSVPQLAVALTADALGGWNVHLQVKNFVFAPHLANEVHQDGTGHAHLYVDGQKFARIYAPWLHLPSLGAGQHELRFVLNSNDHREYVAQGRSVEQILVIEE